MKQWKNSVEQLAREHERAITCILLIVAAVLLFVAWRGKPHHKAAALIYIVL